MADGASGFTVGAYHEAGLVNKTQNGQMKAVAEVDKAAKLLCGGSRHGTSIKHTIIADHRDGMPVEARKACD